MEGLTESLYHFVNIGKLRVKIKQRMNVTCVYFCFFVFLVFAITSFSEK